MSDVGAARARYAEMLAANASLRSVPLVRAFATVPRERYLGAGPWHVLENVPFGYVTTTDADPVHVYRDFPVAIRAERLLNNGQPSFVAGLIDALDLREGDRVFHVGCGTGYYTAVMAEVVGASGAVTAVEVAPDLAGAARRNLEEYEYVSVVCADGGECDGGDPDAILVNAGGTHPRSRWLDRLASGGRLVFPLVRWPSQAEESGSRGVGVVMRVAREASGWAARVLMSCLFFPCIGGIDAEADRALAAAFARLAESGEVRSLRRERHAREANCWLHGEGYCFSTRAL